MTLVTITAHTMSDSNDWKDLLEKAREALKRLECSCDTTSQKETEWETVTTTCITALSSNFHKVSHLIQDYLTEIKQETKYEIKLKLLIVDTRVALRFALSLLGCACPRIRLEIQRCAISDHAIHIALTDLISNRTADAKCRTTAAKVLCNLGTANKTTAQIILKDVQPSPSKLDATRIMLEKIACTNEFQLDSQSLSQSFTGASNCSAFSWAQMVHSSGGIGDRKTLAAVAAALHNSIVSIVDSDNDAHDSNLNSNNEWNIMCCALCSDHMLVSNLVRYILPAQVIQPEKKVGSATGACTTEETDFSDDATEWISRLLEKLCTLGMLPRLFAALGSENESNIQGVTPEQLVLLHCIASAVEDYNEHSLGRPNGGMHDFPLGIHLSERSSSFQCLIDQYCAFRRQLKRAKDDHEERYNGEYACMENAANLILDILSNALSVRADKDDQDYNGNDSDVDSFANMRKITGQTTDILPMILLDLGRLVDKFGIENRGVKARELKITENDQHLVTSIVRLIGNICYKCKENQDLVRNTIVPMEEYTQPPKEPRDIEKEEGTTSTRRNGLHVLLSCTSFAYGCFTLREWAIVAIRTTLDDNPENQKEVEELEAHQALETPELKKLGVKVDMDKRGKVKVSFSPEEQRLSKETNE